MFLNVKMMCIHRENYMWMKDLIVVYSEYLNAKAPINET